MSIPLQQRRQYLSDPPSPSQLPLVEIKGPQKWSWLNDAAGKRASRRVSHRIRQRRLKIACGTFGIIFLVWIIVGLYFYYSGSLFSKVTSTRIDSREESDFKDFATNRNSIVQINVTRAQHLSNREQSQLFRESEEHMVRFPPVSKSENVPSYGTNAANYSKTDREMFGSLRRGPPPGGPVLVQRTIPNVVYPGATSNRMHGKLGISPDGRTLWTPTPKLAVINMAQVLREGGGFNLPLSDSLSLDRVAPDDRHRLCKRQKYNLEELPEASVIIVFYNEPFSTLMRSVHSVLNRTPPLLLKEVLLVDDGSTKPHIVSSPDKPSLLERYVATLPKVKLLRNPTRTGIVGARSLGIQNCQSDIFVILDSHIEVQPQWLEPIVHRIQQDRRRIVMPQVDGINARTFEYSGGGIGCTLGMIWDLMEHSFTPDNRNPARMRKEVTDFVESPTMAGGLFGAHRDYFLEIGGYDRGMTFWGVENLELSFRLWQCGGVLECSQCSRVYHIFRDGGHGYSIPDPQSLIKNKLRTMAVWMDEYADLAWNVLGRPVADLGDISERKALRERLECKPFSFFLNTVWPESDVRNLTKDVPFMGRLRNNASGLCLTSPNAAPDSNAELKDCDDPRHGMMYFRRSGRIMPTRNDEACLSRTDKSIEFVWCRQQGMDNARWRVASTGQVVLEPDENEYTQNIEDELDKSIEKRICLAVTPGTLTLTSVLCHGKEKVVGGLRRPKEEDIQYQMWEWDIYKPPVMWTPPPFLNE